MHGCALHSPQCLLARGLDGRPPPPRAGHPCREGPPVQVTPGWSTPHRCPRRLGAQALLGSWALSSPRMLKEMVSFWSLREENICAGPPGGRFTGSRVHPVTRPVSWKTGPASLAGSAFSSDVEGDGPKSRAVPIAPKEHGLRSAGRLARVAVVCQRFWRQRKRASSSSRLVPGALGTRPLLAPRSLREDCGGPSSPPAEPALVRPPRALPAAPPLALRSLSEDCGGPSTSPVESALVRPSRALGVPSLFKEEVYFTKQHLLP